MLSISEEFLAEIGLGGLPEPARDRLIRQVRQRLESLVGTALVSGMRQEAMDEMGAFVDQDTEKTTAWLEANVDDWRAKLAERNCDLFTLAMHMWLSKERPDYREVVHDQLADIRLELLEHHEAIGKYLTASCD